MVFAVRYIAVFLAFVLLGTLSPAEAKGQAGHPHNPRHANTFRSSGLQCVPFARDQSGIALRGDAWTWWNAAAGQYDRGQAPRPGAVVVFKKQGSMSHGHVAVVAKVMTARRILVDHANWAPTRGGARGHITTQVVVTDVSKHNDWSEVRVWNEASAELGTKTYPTYGFIYAGRQPNHPPAAGTGPAPEVGAASLWFGSAPGRLPFEGSVVLADFFAAPIASGALAEDQHFAE